MVSWVFVNVNIGSGNGLLPYGTKPLTEPMLTYHQYGHVASTQGQLPKDNGSAFYGGVTHMCKQTGTKPLSEPMLT